MLLKRFSTFLLMIAIALVGIQCDKGDDPVSPNEHVNSWILENMDFWYYWSSEIPANPDKSQDPKTFFESLLSDHDRFSWIQENFIELLNSLRGVTKESGFEFVLYRESESSNTVIAQILYVKPSSPAESAGLHRGDVITQINGTTITVDNYQSLIGALSESNSVLVKPLVVENKAFLDPRTVNLVPVEYAENPNFYTRVIEAGDRKIGYYVYNLFALGPDANSNEYMTEMESVFQGFKSAGITDLVIDLRYNSGGSLTAAQSLASYLGKNVDASKVFVKYEYNEQVTSEIKTNPNLGEGYLTVPFLVKSQNVGGLLRDSRIYVLTGSRTASASELIINGLKPYMDVFLIGNTTVGKNVGSVSLYDENDPDNTWGIQPIVTKLINSAGQSDYTNGFVPQIENKDNGLYIYPLGDSREALLSTAIAQITGAASPARTSSDAGKQVLLHSLDLKRRSGVLTVTIPQ